MTVCESPLPGYLIRRLVDRGFCVLRERQSDRESDPTSVVALACSRIGNDGQRRREICRLLVRWMLDHRDRNFLAVVAAGSAIEPWAIRAGELFGVRVARLNFGRDRQRGDRDRHLVAVADGIEAFYVRKDGVLHAALTERLATDRSGRVRVGVSTIHDSAAADLIRRGAVGRCLFNSDCFSDTDADDRDETHDPRRWTATIADPAWIDDPNGWLIHCTRGQPGVSPKQTERQMMDQWLLDDRFRPCDPVETLCRILASGHLLASAVASDRRYPVVCFSATSLADRMRHRRFRPHLKRWDFEPYGVAIRRQAGESVGIVPVIYGKPKQKRRIPVEQHFRFQAIGTTFDWTSEREHRSATHVDLHQFATEDVRIFVRDQRDVGRIAAFCRWPISVVGPTMKIPAQQRHPSRSTKQEGQS